MLPWCGRRRINDWVHYQNFIATHPPHEGLSRDGLEMGGIIRQVNVEFYDFLLCVIYDLKMVSMAVISRWSIFNNMESECGLNSGRYSMPRIKFATKPFANFVWTSIDGFKVNWFGIVFVSLLSSFDDPIHLFILWIVFFLTNNKMHLNCNSSNLTGVIITWSEGGWHFFHSWRCCWLITI